MNIYTKMTLYALLFVVALANSANAKIVDLSCSDNGACLDKLTRDVINSIRDRRAVRLFDFITIEPTSAAVEGRSSQGAVARFLSTNAISIDVSDKTFRITKPSDRNGVLNVDVFEGRAIDDDEEEEEEQKTKQKGSTDKVEDGKSPIHRIRRRSSKRVMQVIVPMILGMKSASAVMVAIFAVAVLTLKAFVASKIALAVTLGMAAKRIYDSIGHGVGLQNHPYLYSQYPVDFSGASSHAYVSGVGTPQFASPEIYGPTALASHTHQHEMLQQSDASAQQSQSAPTLHVVNATRATERWDGMRRRPMFYGPSRATSDSYLEYQDYRH